MTLELEVANSFCVPVTFRINGIEAVYNDFGDKFDESPEESPEEGGCGDMRFERKDSTSEILEKYDIKQVEYDQVCEQLEEKLSFGECNWCS